MNKDKESFSMQFMEYANQRDKTILSIIKYVIIFASVIFIAFLAVTGYLIYTLNDIESTETITTEEVVDMSSNDNGNNNYIGGDNNGEIKNS